MVAHELIAALAGDEEARSRRARAAATVDATAPDHIPPADEFLVLDADASQNYAINAVLAGQDLIVKGPPGTGKSQTIANLVSTLVARGKRFCSWPRSVPPSTRSSSGLNDVGLGDLVLDLHGGAGSRRKVAKSLGAALDAKSRLPRPNHEAEQRLVENRRERAQRHASRRSTPCATRGASSFFDAQSRLLMGIDPTAHTTVRFRGETLSALDERAIEQPPTICASYAGLGGLTLSAVGLAVGRRGDPSAASRRSACLGPSSTVCAQHTLPNRLSALLGAAATQTGNAAAETMSGWGDLLALWQQIASDDADLRPRCLRGDLSIELVPVLAPLAAGSAPAARLQDDRSGGLTAARAKQVQGASTRDAHSQAAPRAAHALTSRRRS